MWQAFLWSSSVWTTVKAQRDKIASWSARMVANVIGTNTPPWMDMGQWCRHWLRTGHRRIEKSNMNVLTAIRERVLSWAGHVARMDYSEICAKALGCRGLQATTPLERSGEGQMGWSAPKTIQNLQMGGHGVDGGLQVCLKCRWLCGISPFVHRMVATR